MDNWNEIRTAAYVARIGQVSGAAEVLGIHRATVHRHIDALEAALGAKLFLRHARGFTPTELGLELLRIADATDDQFATLKRSAGAHSDALSGQLVITALDVVASDIFRAVTSFRDEHPKVAVCIVGSGSILKLEYGEAHIAIRMGKRPDHPDNVVLPFRQHRMCLYASKDYAARYGVPKTEADFGAHRFIGPHSAKPRAKFLAWMLEKTPPEAIALRSDEPIITRDAILGGLGIGFLPEHVARRNGGLVMVQKPRADWVVGSWIVTHVDLHRSAKVQAFLKHLKEAIKSVS